MNVHLFIEYTEYDKNIDLQIKQISKTKSTNSKDYRSLIENELKKVGRKIKHVRQATVSTRSGTPLFVINALRADYIEENSNAD